MKASDNPGEGQGIVGALRSRAKGGDTVSFQDFVDVALYDPVFGYYRRAGARVGRSPDSDFFTSSSSRIFGHLVAGACAKLLAPLETAAVDFIEIGAEPGGGVLRDQAHPFRSAREVRLGDALEIRGQAVVFSNELFDAQPFRRFRYRGGAWRELGVCFASGQLREVEIGAADPGQGFPASAEDGYTIDASLAATALASSIAAQPWKGLFLAFDYGKSWEELAHSLPAGTARTYKGHAMGSDLLASPGELDLTCHVCWDWISQALGSQGFGTPTLESQEAFFVHHGAAAIARLAEEEAGRLSRDKLSLMQLIHPGNMGQKFQAMWALRT